MTHANKVSIALLGRLDLPTDGVRDYCRYLSEAFSRSGEDLRIEEVRWDTQGWPKALRELWNKSKLWKGRWVLVQYTALMWSRRGFPIGALAVLFILRLRGSKICVVFHDVRYDLATNWKQRLRVAFQYRTMRVAFRWAAQAVLTVPASQVSWLPRNTAKGSFIPVGTNFPSVIQAHENNGAKLHEIPTVAVFGVTGNERADGESQDISYVMRSVISKLAAARLIVMGRGSLEAEPMLRKELSHSGVELCALGVLSYDQIREKLLDADVLLCVRGHVSSRRGSAIAGIACGLPVVGYRGEETAFPITEAGVLLLNNGDRAGVADAICRVLSDQNLRQELRLRNFQADRKYFSWDAIAAQFIALLSE